ncbi:hypothetical protein [Streptomyces sp. S186]|uniref:hypothetical protein n=1 Tax=Streptomyces sp. S186 TaxID=3434395 RepID=UPI003F67F214
MANRPGQARHGFLGWPSEHGLTLPTCRQANIDAWHVEHNEHGRNTIRPFLLWCMASKLTRRFRLPTAVIRQASPSPDFGPCRCRRSAECLALLAAFGAGPG